MITSMSYKFKSIDFVGYYNNSRKHSGFVDEAYRYRPASAGSVPGHSLAGSQHNLAQI
jgi:hypothetical protein